jgi:hypothetical protein
MQEHRPEQDPTNRNRQHPNRIHRVTRIDEHPQNRHTRTRELNPRKRTTEHDHITKTPTRTSRTAARSHPQIRQQTLPCRTATYHATHPR